MTGVLDAALSFISNLLDFALFGSAETKKEGQGDNILLCGTSQHINVVSSCSSPVFCLPGIAQRKANAGNKNCQYLSS